VVVKRAAIILALFLIAISMVSSVSAAANLFVVRVVVPVVASPGSNIGIFIEAAFNGTLVDGVSLSLRIFYLDAGQVKAKSLSHFSNLGRGQFGASYVIPENASGVFSVHVSGSYRNFSAMDVAGVSIVSNTTAQIGDVSSELQSLGTQVDSLDNRIVILQSQVEALDSQVAILKYGVIALAAALLIVALSVVTRNRKT
jgi:peptidoglycan hydrolase CwlO-like protein